MVQLAAALGVTLFPSWDEGLTVDWHQGQRSTYQGLFPPASERLVKRRQLTQMAGTVPLETPGPHHRRPPGTSKLSTSGSPPTSARSGRASPGPSRAWAPVAQAACHCWPRC